MSSLCGCAMAEFRSQAFIVIGVGFWIWQSKGVPEWLICRLGNHETRELEVTQEAQGLYMFELSKDIIPYVLCSMMLVLICWTKLKEQWRV